MYERFTDRARKVMQLANQEAHRFNHEYVGTEHILLGLMKEGSGVAANVLENLEIDLRKLRLEVEKIICRGPEMLVTGRLPQTPRAKKVIEYAIEEARNLNHNYVGTEHLLLGLVREELGVAAQVLKNLGLRSHDVRAEVLDILGHPRPAKKSSEEVVQRDVPLSATAAEEGIRFLELHFQSERMRNRSLEKQFWNVRVLLGALLGGLAGTLLLAQFGAVMGLLLGGLVAALGWRTLGILAGGGVGTMLGCTHLPNDGGGLAGAARRSGGSFDRGDWRAD